MKFFFSVGALTIASISSNCKKHGATDSHKTEISVKGRTTLMTLSILTIPLSKNTKKSKPIGKNLQYLDKAVAKSKGENVPCIPPVIPMIGFGKKDISEVQKLLEKIKRQWISLTQVLILLFLTLRKNEELKSYMSAEYYKDDKAAKADAIAKEIETGCNTFLLREILY